MLLHVLKKEPKANYVFSSKHDIGSIVVSFRFPKKQKSVLVYGFQATVYIILIIIIIISKRDFVPPLYLSTLKTHKIGKCLCCLSSEDYSLEIRTGKYDNSQSSLQN